MFRIGHGFDVHQLVEGRPLIIGGVRIPHNKGLLGHSDADVLIHAICDALLGALALGDIGKFFPDTDNTYKNIDSKILLTKVVEFITNKGYVINNIDSTICMQKPKLAPHILLMRQTLTSVMHINLDQLSIKATTTEHLGYEGREEGVSATAIVLLQK